MALLLCETLNSDVGQFASVNAVLDHFGAGALHLQTFFPSSEASESYCEWMLGMVKVVAANDHGSWLTRASVNWR